MAEAFDEPVPADRQLREIAARQVKGETPRRWFASARCDLIVWLNEDGSPRGFQFCYDKDHREHALTWIAGAGFSHMRVDTGYFPGGHKGTPLLLADGVFDLARIAGIFRDESSLLPADIASLVDARLAELDLASKA